MSAGSDLADRIRVRRAAVLACIGEFGLSPNPAIDDAVLAFRHFPDKPSKKMAILIAAYQREATSDLLSQISSQSAGLVKDLRRDGFTFQKGNGKGEAFYYRNSSGSICRRITGFIQSPIKLSPYVQQLLNKSVAACLSAIEVYNKPDFKYREESFSILMVNAWELLLKAECISKEGKVNSIYVKDGGGFKLNRCNNPMTIGIDAAADKLCQAKILDGNCWKNIELLLEIRDNAIHFINKSQGLGKKVLEIGMAALRNYITAVSDWFSLDLSSYNFYLMPMSFFHEADIESVSIARPDQRVRNMVKFLQQATEENTSNAENPYVVTLNVKTKLIRTYGPEAVMEVRYTQDSSAPKLAISEENVIQKLYPLKYKDVVAYLKNKYPTFKQNASFHAKLKEIIAGDTRQKLSRTWHADALEKKDTPRRFYSPEILKAFERYYQK